jgi:hypothetical protein
MFTDDSETFRLDNFVCEVVGGACLKPTVLICIIWFNPENSIYYPQAVFLRYVWPSEKLQTHSQNSLQWMIVITVVVSVTVQSIHRRPRTAEAGLRSRANPCELRWEE